MRDLDAPPAGTLQLEVGEQASGQRLDRWLCDQLPGMSRAAARRLIDEGHVRVDGRRSRAGARINSGARVTMLEPQISTASPEPGLPLQLCYEDRFLVVVDKPSGMPCHPLRAGERGTLASALLARYPEMAAVGYAPAQAGLLHRLDTDTSGLVLAARDRETFVALREQLRAGAIDKRYLALCAGSPRAPAQLYAYLLAHGPRVRVETEPFREAVAIATELLSAEPHGQFSLLRVRAHVARRHQIRAHLAALGHPLAGDARYGGAELPGLTRQFLHAESIGCVHPQTGVALEVKAALPAELADLVERLDRLASES